MRLDVRFGRLRPFVVGPPSLAALLLAVSACSVNPAPVETDLSTPVPMDWAAREEPTTGPPATSSWWRSFGDDSLDTLIAEALERNTDLRAAAARVQAAAARARIAGADLTPQVGADITGARSKRNFIGFPIPGGAGDVLSSTSTNLGAGLNISWEADLWGRLRAREASAGATLIASERELDAARLSLAGQVAKSWFALLESDGQVRVAERTLESRRVTRDRIRRRYNAGLASPLELRFAISDHALAESLLAQRQRQAQTARRVLQLLVFRYPSGELDEAAGADSLPDLPGPIPAGLPAELVTRRPDLAAAESRLVGAGYSVTEARRALYPRLTLTGSAGTASAEIGDLLDEDFSVWSIAGGLLAPLFQGGRLRAAVDLAEARQEETLMLYLQQVLGAFSEVEESLAAARFLDRREGALRVAVEEADKALELAQDQYAAGLVTYLAVLESQRQSLNAESQLLSVRRQRLEARIDLHLALGGDWGPHPGDPAISPTLDTALPASTSSTTDRPVVNEPGPDETVTNEMADQQPGSTPSES